jgi:hypothetical protein
MKVSGMSSIHGEHTFEIGTEGISIYPKDIVLANDPTPVSTERISSGATPA